MSTPEFGRLQKFSYSRYNFNFFLGWPMSLGLFWYYLIPCMYCNNRTYVRSLNIMNMFNVLFVKVKVKGKVTLSMCLIS